MMKMSDDLVKRLRHWQEYGPYRPSRYKEAADRIEQLESALREIADFELHCDNSNAYRIPPIARAALGERKDD
jgi:hypothetical protein